MLIIDIIKIVGFDLKHTDKYPLSSREDIYFHKNYKLSIMKNLYDENTYTLWVHRDGKFFTNLDIFGKNISRPCETIFININEEDAIEIMKDEFNSIIRKYKIEKLNIKN